MPLVNPNIELYPKFQFLLNRYRSVLEQKDFLMKKPKVNDSCCDFVKSIGLDTFQDYLDASDKQVIQFYRHNKIQFYKTIEFFGVLCDYCQSCCPDEKCSELRPIIKSIILKGENNFLDKEIEYNLYPKFARRIKIALERIGVHKYRDLQKYVDRHFYDLPRIGSFCNWALQTIIYYDHLLFLNQFYDD